MAKLIPGPIVVRQTGETEVESEGCDYAVRFEDGFIYEAKDADDARQTAVMTNGLVLVREVWVTAWAELVEFADEEEPG